MPAHAASVGDAFLTESMLLAYFLVFLTGCSSLVYEIAWIRRASFAFGSSSLALSSVLAVFMLGLGLGGLLTGRAGIALRRPLLACAALEGALALNGAFCGALFDAAETVYGMAYRSFEADSAWPSLLRLLLLGVLLTPPAMAMGGTLPLFCRWRMRDPARVAGDLGLLYGCNTLGATVGCLLAGFLLLPALGLNASLQVAAGMNLCAALGFWRLSAAREPSQAFEVSARASPEPAMPPPSRLPGALFFMIGATALANELLWARFLTHFVRNSVYTYSLTLGVVLFGAAAGSAWSGARWDRIRSARALWLAFAVLQAMSAASNLVLTHLPAPFWRALSGLNVLPFALSMAPSALIAGVSFPLLNRLVVREPGQAPRAVGAMVWLNILGCVFGSLAIGWLCLPYLGLDRSLYLVAGWSVGAAVLALCLGAGKPAAARESAAWGAVGGALALCVGLWAFPPVRIPQDLSARKETLLAFAEGYNSTLAAVSRQGVKTLTIDGLWQGVDGKNYQIMTAHTPMLHYPQAKDILVVGLGAGTTARRFLEYGVERLDIVDIEPRLFGFVRANFSSDWMDDPRTHLIAEDGRNYLKHTRRTYDFISAEIGQLDRPGVGAFYTVEFYREAKAHLREGGMIAQFTPLRFLRPEEFAGVLKTFLAEFPNARLWYNTDELLLIGFKGEAPSLAPERFAQTLERRPLREDLNFSYWDGPLRSLHLFPNFVAGFLAAGPELEALAAIAPAPVYTDDKLQLSYSVSDYRRADGRALTLAPIVRAHLSPLERTLAPGALDEAGRKAAERLRTDNVNDIAASDILDSLDASDPPPDDATVYRQARAALEWNPKNPEALKRMREAAVRLGRRNEALPQ